MFKDRLKQAREEKSIIQQDMADMLDIRLRTYQRYESGDIVPPLYTASKISDILGVSVDYLLGKTDKKAIDR